MKNIDFTDFFNVFLSGATILCISFLFHLKFLFNNVYTLAKKPLPC